MPNKSILLSLITSIFIMFGEVNSLFYFYYFFVLSIYSIFFNFYFFKLIRIITTLSVIPCSIYFAEGFKSVEFASILLAMLSLLKIFEIKSRKDFENFILIFILYFSASIMLSGQIYVYMLALICIGISFYDLARMNKIQMQAASFYKIIKLFGLALIPISLLYLVIPQIGVGGFRSFSRTNEAVSGIGTELSPGTFFEISKDSSIHLAIDLNNLKQNLRNFYWRVYTFEINDGKNWRGDAKVEYRADNEISLLTVTDLTNRSLPKIKNSFYAPIKESFSFNRRVRTYPLGKVIEDKETLQFKTTPRLLKVSNITPSLEKFLQDIQGESATEKFNLLIKKLQTLNLKYSTSKTIVESSDMSDFLFKNKLGYCEHFASAVAVSLRVLGVPSRVVVGYYGGKFNEKDKLLFLTGENAHAWIEYFDGEKWIEEDPVELLVSAIYLPTNDMTTFYENEKIQTSFDPSKILSELYIYYMTLNYNFFSFDLEIQKKYFQNLKESVYLIFNKVKEDSLRLVLQLVILFLSCVAIFFILLTDSYFLKIVATRVFRRENIKLQDLESLGHSSGHFLYALLAKKRYSSKKWQLPDIIKIQYYKIWILCVIFLKTVKKP